VETVISDDQVAALRALLVENFAEYEHLANHFERTNAWSGFNYLIAAAFYEAVYRKFGKGCTIPEIIRFVADERARIEDPEADFDARVAERLILAALGNDSVEGIDERMKGHAQVSLLLAMVTGVGLDDADLDEFLRAARKVADSDGNRGQIG
jgi:hypothetical protein